MGLHRSMKLGGLAKQNNSINFKRRIGVFCAIFAFIAVLGIGGYVLKSNTFAKQLTASIEIQSLEMFNNVGAEVDLQRGAAASQNPADYTVKLRHNVPTQINLVVNVKLGQGEVISAGDTLNISIVRHLTSGTADLTVFTADSATLYNDTGVDIGSFKVYGNSRIELTFNENVDGATALNDLTLNLGRIARASGIGYDRVGSIKIGGVDFYFGVAKRQMYVLNDLVTNSGSSNDRIVWGTRIGADLANDLSSSRGTYGEPVEAVVEQYFPGAKSGGNVRIGNPYRIPYNLENSSVMSEVAVSDPNDYVSKYTQITQATNETYDSFKARVTAAPSQYGYYTDDTGVTFVANYGKLGVDTPFASANDWAEYVAGRAIETGYYPESDRQALIDYYLACFGDGSVMDQLPMPTTNLSIYYPTVLEDTVVTTSAKITYDGVEKTLTNSATLTGIMGSTSVESNAVMLFVSDGDTGKMIPGGTFKLQVKQDDGTYKDFLADDGGELIREGGSDGTLIFSNLPNGTYRIVELTAPDGYSLKNSEGYNEEDGVIYSEDFVIDSSNEEGVKIILKNVPGSDEVDEEEEPTDDTVEEAIVAVPDTGHNSKGFGGDIDVIGFGLGGVAFVVMVAIYAKKTGKRKMEY